MKILICIVLMVSLHETVQAAPCKDKSGFGQICLSWKSYGYCKNKVSIAKKYCPATCRFCKSSLPSEKHLECNYFDGVGVGGPEEYISRFKNSERCRQACIKRIKTNNAINGSTYSPVTFQCYCQSSQTGRKVSYSYKKWHNCWFGKKFKEQTVTTPTPTQQKPTTTSKPTQQKPTSTSKPTQQKPTTTPKPTQQKPKTNLECKYVDGYGSGGRNDLIGTFNTSEGCRKACIILKDTYPAVNGATYSAERKQCYCEFSQTRLKHTPEDWKNCWFGKLYKEQSSCNDKFPCGRWKYFGFCKTYSVSRVAENCPATCGFCKSTECKYFDGVGIGGANNSIGIFNTSDGCRQACVDQIDTNPAINGATYSPITNECYCEFNQTGRKQTPNGLQNCWFGKMSREPKYLCQYVPGDGTGRSERYISRYDTSSECSRVCMSLMKNSDPTINGATYAPSTKACYCEQGQTGRKSSSKWQNCMFRKV